MGRQEKLIKYLRETLKPPLYHNLRSSGLTMDETKDIIIDIFGIIDYDLNIKHEYLQINNYKSGLSYYEEFDENINWGVTINGKKGGLKCASYDHDRFSEFKESKRVSWEEFKKLVNG